MTFINDNEELEQFKRHDIRSLLPALGWQSLSAAEVATTKHRGRVGDIFGDGSRYLHTFRTGAGVWMFKFHEGSTILNRDRGTVLHVAQEYVSGSIGHARVKIREILGTCTGPTLSPSAGPRTPAANLALISSSTYPYPTPVAIDEKKAPDQLYSEYLTGSHPVICGEDVPDYLKMRWINMFDEIFEGQVRQTIGGKVRFPYLRFSDEITSKRMEFAGFEEKGKSWKSFSTGGRAGIWIGGQTTSAHVVVVESPLDAMAYSIFHCKYAHFVAVRSGGERDVVRYLELLSRDRRLSSVTLATDNDAAGHVYAGKIGTALNRFKEDRFVVSFELSGSGHNDHCDALKEAAINRDHPYHERVTRYMKLKQEVFADMRADDIASDTASPTRELLIPDFTRLTTECAIEELAD
ncbi:Toprim-like [Loktanella salsilacus]|uniref:Toprim-like n=1 Tax=Loktanella salsilacus TaxID=195913 RepID=A0A1I4EUX1_9RHOB|nr:toprim domain-containing protein [Loktanella salsilacus]SFL09535.1 Toprim-like [Loktanella salsilacus]